MTRRLRLFPNSTAATQWLAEAEGGALLAGDLAQGFFAFTLGLAQAARPVRLSTEAERL